MNVIGIDGTTPGLEAVKSGKMLGTVSSNKEIYASAILELAAGCALGKETPKEYPLVDGTGNYCFGRFRQIIKEKL